MIMTDNSDRWVIPVSVPPPSLSDNRADADRLATALKSVLHTDDIRFSWPLLKILPRRLRANPSGEVRCVVMKDRQCFRVVGIKDLSDPTPAVGLAVDLGTTRVVMRLINLETGEALAETAMDNPQIPIGPDILARIHYAASDAGRHDLHVRIINGINAGVADLCRQAAITADDVFLMAIAGNTSMTHLFLEIVPDWIIREPYIPAANRFSLMTAAELGIAINPNGCVFVFPNVGSYFGGDLIAGILYSGLHRREEIAMLVDVGTNAEVLLGNRDWLVACAGAAGPALEGGMSRIGTTARPGVIDEIRIDPQTHEFHIHTIGDQRPVGICGSGMIDLAAQLFLTGMIDLRGKFVKDACGGRLIEEDGIRRITVVPADQSATGSELAISQTDIDSLVRSKAAMYAILETITAYVGVTFDDIATFFVAGTFGSFIKPRSAISIGMIPDLPETAYQPLGNSSLEGASLALTSRAAFDEIDSIRDRITYLELNVNPEFMGRFSAAKFLPHTDPARFPSVKRSSGGVASS
jgi:uncharacterized 2Fe-2S/4Fe-4S cluster protein (DUF4445 family)